MYHLISAIIPAADSGTAVFFLPHIERRTIVPIFSAQHLHKWPAEQPPRRIRRLPRVPVADLSPHEAAVRVDVLQLSPRVGRLVAQRGRRRLLAARIAGFHVCGPQGGADGVGEGEEDAGYGDHFEHDGGDAEAVDRSQNR